MKEAPALKFFYYLLLIFIILAFHGPVSGAEDWLEQGVSNLKTQHIEEAILAFTKAISVNPGRVEAYNNRGIAWCRKGDYDRALADYNKALELDARCAEVYNNRGIIWFYKDKYDLAINDYDKALGIDPNFAKAYSNRGAAWYCKGKLDLAVGDYTRALEINPNSAETNKQLAWILSVYPDNAKKRDFKAVVLPPKDAGFHPGTAPPGTDLTAPFTENGKAGGTAGIEREKRIQKKKAGLMAKSAEHTKPPQPSKVSKPGQSCKPKDNTKVYTDIPPRQNRPETDRVSSSMAFSVQVGAFGSRENAEKLAAHLKEKGYAVYLLPLKSWSKKLFFTVRLGRHATRQEAEEQAAEFSAREGMPSTVRPANEL